MVLRKSKSRKESTPAACKARIRLKGFAVKHGETRFGKTGPGGGRRSDVRGALRLQVGGVTQGQKPQGPNKTDRHEKAEFKMCFESRDFSKGNRSVDCDRSRRVVSEKPFVTKRREANPMYGIGTEEPQTFGSLSAAVKFDR